MPICGHSRGPYGSFGNSMMGREESIKVIERGGVKYVARVEYGPCSICNKEQDKRINREILALIRRKHRKIFRAKCLALNNRYTDEIALLEDVYELLCGVGLERKDSVIARLNARIVELRQ